MNDFEQTVTQVLIGAVSRLREADVPLEALADFVPEHRRMLVKRAATMQPVGEAWRLGSLLLCPDLPVPRLFAVGHATRAAIRPHPGNQSVSREERRDIAAAALKGGYAEGAAVNFDAVPLPLDAASLRALDPGSPIGLVETPAGPELRVRWRAGASLDGAQTLENYLAERIDLLTARPGTE